MLSPIQTPLIRLAFSGSITPILHEVKNKAKTIAPLLSKSGQLEPFIQEAGTPVTQSLGRLKGIQQGYKPEVSESKPGTAPAAMEGLLSKAAGGLKSYLFGQPAAQAQPAQQQQSPMPQPRTAPVSAGPQQQPALQAGPLGAPAQPQMFRVKEKASGRMDCAIS